jgi:hypothetical protein
MVLFALMLGVGVAFGTWAVSPAQPQLSVPDSELDLGDVWVVSAHQREISIANVGRSSVHIDRFFASCQCTSISPAELDLAPGEVRRVGFTFNLAGTSLAENGGRAVPFEIQVRPILSSHQTVPQAWNFRGRARSLFVNTAGSVLLDASRLVRVNGEPCRDTVEVKPVVPLAKLHALTDLPNCKVVASPRGDVFRLDFEFGPSVPTRSHEFDVLLEAEFPDGTVVDGIRLKTIAPVSHEWEAIPASLEFGLLRPRETAEVKMLIRSRLGNAATTVTVAPPPATASISVAPPRVADGEWVIAATVQAPDAPGFYQHALGICVKGADNALPLTIRVPLRYQVRGANAVRCP